MVIDAPCCSVFSRLSSVHSCSLTKMIVVSLTKNKVPAYYLLVGFSIQVSKWCLYGSYFKDNKAREHAGTREIMQSIPVLAYEIPIRNFILRFRPRSSQFHSARYTEHLNLIS